MPDIEKLRDTILLSEVKVLGVTSVKSGVGKTYISKLLSKSFEEIGKTALHLSLGNTKKSDSIIALENELESVSNINGKNFVALLDSALRAKIVYGGDFEELIHIYSEQYDYIIVDMPSIEEDSVAKKLCTLCDEIIVLVSKDSEDGQEVGKVIKQLLNLDVKIAGIVMNEYKTKKLLIRI